jgi:hypothetical protein
MKAILFSFVILLAVSSCSDKKEILFNGQNLDGWTIFVNDSIISPNDFFYVKDGVIETVGIPVGYLRTVKEYSDYKLHIEWRYPEEPTNSGVFVHTNGPDLIWPGHYQGQLKHLNAGDFIVHGVGMSATLRDTVYTSSAENKPLIAKINPTNEKPAGEWNSYDITCKGNTIEFRVNGLLQNVATNCSVTEGGIGLQAEGSKIQFRNLWIEPLK